MRGCLLLGAFGIIPVVWALNFPFNEGQIPLTIGSGPREFSQGKNYSAEQCRNCHTQIHQQWETSRHRRAWTNEIFQDGFRAEPLARCVFCHAPLDVQASELLPQLKQYSQTDRGKNTHLPVLRGPLSAEGVTCVVCHVRDGAIHAAKPNPNALHDVRADAGLSQPEFCANCHQFHFQGAAPPGQSLMQSTYEEWRAYAAAGGPGTCQSCHMPEGSHEFHGANDRTLLRKSLKLTWNRVGQSTRFTLQSVGVGHSLPTGDLFRHVTFEIKSPTDEQYHVLKRWGRDFIRVGLLKRVANDTSIKPFGRELWEVTDPEFSYRLVYHYGSPENERRGTLPDSYLRETIGEGIVKPLTAARSSPLNPRPLAEEFRVPGKSSARGGE